APECGDRLGHLDRVGDDPLSTTCYMWWHIFPTRPDPDRQADQQLLDALLSTVNGILSLPSEACCESALHGLGHQRDVAPQRVREVVDRFLAGRPHISPELRSYALRAKEGEVA